MQNKLEKMNGFLNNENGWSNMAKTLANKIPTNEQQYPFGHIKYSRTIALAQLRKKAIIHQMAFYLASYANECDIDGYFVYLIGEQSCLFLHDIDDKLDTNDICIPIYEFTSSNALYIVPTAGFRDNVELGDLNRVMYVLEQYIDNFFITKG